MSAETVQLGTHRPRNNSSTAGGDSPIAVARESGQFPGHSSAPRRKLTVLMAGPAHAAAAPGGGDVQRLRTAAALGAFGVEAVLGRPTPERLAHVDCLHLFGSVPEHLASVAVARRMGVPVVLSTIAWFELANCWREPRPMVWRACAALKFLGRAACPRLPSWRRRLYRAVDLLLPNSRAEAAQLVRYFGASEERVHVVPNGAESRFARGEPDLFARGVGGRRFVLCAGRVEPRKNQLGLLRSMRESGLPVVVLGDAVPGHARYLARCRETASPRVRFLPRLEHDDPLLAAAYAACGCLVLPGWFETPGLAALEAALSGAPLVLTTGGATREYFREHAVYVDPDDHAGMRRAIERAVRQPRNLALASHVRKNFTWQAAARATRRAYERVR